MKQRRGCLWHPRPFAFAAFLLFHSVGGQRSALPDVVEVGAKRTGRHPQEVARPGDLVPLSGRIRPDHPSRLARLDAQGWLDRFARRPVERRSLDERTADCARRQRQQVAAWLIGLEGSARGIQISVRVVDVHVHPIGEDVNPNARRSLQDGRRGVPLSLCVREGWRAAPG